MAEKIARFPERALISRATSKEAARLEYVAFETDDKPIRLRIEAAPDWVHAPSYTYLVDVYFNGERGSQIILLFTFMTVSVRGRKLARVFAEIADRNGSVIRKFDERWKEPRDPSAPFIEKIEFDPDDPCL